MSEEFGPEFISITDEDGNEFELEYVETIEYQGQVYRAFFPADKKSSSKWTLFQPAFAGKEASEKVHRSQSV